MRVKQYVYFAVFDSQLTAAAVKEHLTLDPDDVMVRRSKQDDPPVPVQHMWAIRSENGEAPIGDQVDDVLSRVATIEPDLTSLVPRLTDGGFVLQIVRRLNDPDAPEEDGLGLGLTGSQLQTLARLGASVSVDEYDYSATD